MTKFDWTAETERRLRLWFTVEGLSFAAIAARLGTTRNAVAGKIWRLGLIGQGRNPPKGGRSRLKPPKPSPCCSWPIGDPKAPGFHFCGQPIEPGQTYCPAHSAQAYAKPTRNAKAAEERGRSMRASAVRAIR